jgi:DDE superfamily endonuclease
LADLAAWDVHHANLFDRVEQTTGIVPFSRLVDQVMTVEPYRSARTVYWIVDNGSSHCGKTSVKRMTKTYPNAKLIRLPVHASWLNQIEIYFSILQRKAMTPNDFATLPELARHVMDFGQHYRALARPFQWTFTRAKLDAVIEKITRHQPAPLALAA